MAIITGLKAIQNKIDYPSGGSSDGGPKVRWLKLEDGQSVKVRFINEIDADSPNYNKDRGLAIVVAEHTNPKDYRRKAVCTRQDEGQCYGCDMDRREPKAGWRAKLRYYTNLWVNDGNEEYVAIWSQGVGPKSLTTKTLIEYAADTGSISNLVWRLKRSGTGTSTTYPLFPLSTDDTEFDWSNIEPYDLERSAIRQIPYADQEAFFMGLEQDEEVTSSAAW